MSPSPTAGEDTGATAERAVAEIGEHSSPLQHAEVCIPEGDERE